MKKYAMMLLMVVLLFIIAVVPFGGTSTSWADDGFTLSGKTFDINPLGWKISFLASPFGNGGTGEAGSATLCASGSDYNLYYIFEPYKLILYNDQASLNFMLLDNVFYYIDPAGITLTPSPVQKE